MGFIVTNLNPAEPAGETPGPSLDLGFSPRAGLSGRVAKGALLLLLLSGDTGRLARSQKWGVLGRIGIAVPFVNL